MFVATLRGEAACEEVAGVKLMTRFVFNMRVIAFHVAERMVPHRNGARGR
jgi:hypothetical protein